MVCSNYVALADRDFWESPSFSDSCTVVCRTVVMHQAGIGGGFEVFVAGEQ